MELIEKAATAFPLSLIVTSNGTGVPGLSCTVALRNGATTNSYLDFGDGTFKTSAWSTKNVAMVDLTGGAYHYLLNPSALASLTEGLVLAAEYSDGAGHITVEYFQISKIQAAVLLLRKGLTNRIIATAGNPGQLVLKDDDDTATALAWNETDGSGGAVISPPGSPARRTKATGTY